MLTRYEMNAIARVVCELHNQASRQATGRQVAALAERMLADVCAHNLAFDCERFSRACHATGPEDRADAEKAIPVVQLHGRKSTVRLVSPAEADRLEATGEIIRQAGLLVQRSAAAPH